MIAERANETLPAEQPVQYVVTYRAANWSPQPGDNNRDAAGLFTWTEASRRCAELRRDGLVPRIHRYRGRTS